MAAILKYGAIIPAAIRITLAGGAAYGSVKYGIWSDSTQSREKLERLKDGVRKEIEYPKTKPIGSRSSITSLAGSQTSSSEKQQKQAATPVVTSLATIWNSGVTSTCEYLNTVDGSSVKSVASKASQQFRQLLQQEK